MYEENKNRLLGKERKIYSAIFTAVCAVAIALILALLVFTSAFSMCLVSGESMTPTLADGQYVLLSETGSPSRGDIVVFENDDKLLIKRVVAACGDSVSFEYGENNDVVLVVNGEPQTEDYIKNGRMSDWSGYMYKNDKALIKPGDPPLTLGEDEYFVMGDNRDNSTDSRFESVGKVSRDKLRGVLIAAPEAGSSAEWWLKLLFGIR